MLFTVNLKFTMGVETGKLRAPLVLPSFSNTGHGKVGEGLRDLPRWCSGCHLTLPEGEVSRFLLTCSGELTILSPLSCYKQTSSKQDKRQFCSPLFQELLEGLVSGVCVSWTQKSW